MHSAVHRFVRAFPTARSAQHPGHAIVTSGVRSCAHDRAAQTGVGAAGLAEPEPGRRAAEIGAQ